MFSPDFFVTGHADARSLRQLGITRVGDITGLDSIGLPVWFASRPNSRALSVSQGKGMTHAQARISAVMESAECAVAERPEDIAGLFGSLREIRQAGHRTIPFDRLMRCATGDLDPDRERAWVRGISRKTGHEVLAPYELIGLDMRSKAPWDHDTFKMSSIGLAAGSQPDAVLSHALLEVVEHNSTASLDLLGLGARVARGLQYSAGTHGGLDDAVASIEAAGFTPHFFDLTGNIPLPVIACFMTRTILSDEGAGAKLTAGFACRPDAHEAALAALLECVQSRATDIAGSRDDITASDYQESRGRIPAQMVPCGTLAAVKGHRPRTSFDTAEQLLAYVSDAVLSNGPEDIFVFPLTGPEPGFHVTRALVPGMEVAGESGVSRAGAGLIDALLRGM